jgi:thiol-disulfide isomerase/thioredoxin
MLLIAYGGQTVMHRIRPLMKRSSSIRKGFGFAVVLTAVAMLAQVDGSVTAWMSGLWPKAEAVESRPGTLHALSNQPAPEFVGIDSWLNTPKPLSAAGLKGKVVLVDFWTYSCINCIRTLPHIQKLHERYAAQGLVVIGMHTPEFPFEKDAGNVKAAIKRFGLTYPVAQDNQYKTWDSYKNLYWPAQYLIDRNGTIVFQHYGEGDEALIEKQVRQALAKTTSG